VNQVKYRAPCALTDTRYLEHFIYRVKNSLLNDLKLELIATLTLSPYLKVLPTRGYQAVTLIGFSAGSMLAIAMAGRAGELKELKELNTVKSSSVAACVVECAIGIHGPDRIRDVFEEHASNWSRLDIFFSYSLFNTMCKSGCTDFLPSGGGGGLHEDWLAPLQGWRWMKGYTESCFKTCWEDMEPELWSCRRAMSMPMSIPVFRILSRNDPIINYEECIDEA